MAMSIITEERLNNRAQAVIRCNQRYEQAQSVELNGPYAPHFWIGYTLMNGLCGALRRRSENRFAETIQSFHPEIALNEISFSHLAGRVLIEGSAALTRMPDRETINASRIQTGTLPL